MFNWKRFISRKRYIFKHRLEWQLEYFDYLMNHRRLFEKEAQCLQVKRPILTRINCLGRFSGQWYHTLLAKAHLEWWRSQLIDFPDVVMWSHGGSLIKPRFSSLQTANFISILCSWISFVEFKWCGGYIVSSLIVCVSRSPASDLRVMQKKHQPHIIYHMRNEDPQMHNMFIATDRSSSFGCGYRLVNPVDSFPLYSGIRAWPMSSGYSSAATTFPRFILALGIGFVISLIVNGHRRGLWIVLVGVVLSIVRRHRVSFICRGVSINPSAWISVINPTSAQLTHYHHHHLHHPQPSTSSAPHPSSNPEP